MNLSDLQLLYAEHPQVKKCNSLLENSASNLKISGLNGSSLSLFLASVFKATGRNNVVVMNDADEAAYLYNDLKSILSDGEVFLFPSSFRKSIRLSRHDTANEILRTEVLNHIINVNAPALVVCYPESLLQKVISAGSIRNQTIKIKTGESLEIDFLAEALIEFGFERVDFVYEPGQFSVRGSIVDIFSFSYELPFRCDFFGDEVDSIRVFDIETQLSKERRTEIEIIPDLTLDRIAQRDDFFSLLKSDSLLTFKNQHYIKDRIDLLYDDLLVRANQGEQVVETLSHFNITGVDFLNAVVHFQKIELGEKSGSNQQNLIKFNTSPQPVFHKNFDLIAQNLKTFQTDGYKLFILSDSAKQTQRIAAIFDDRGDNIRFEALKNTLHEGFIDHDLSLLCYTDHQVFDRFHRYALRTDKTRQGKVVLTLKELNQFSLGDYLVHVDHGIGKFGGLVRTNVNGKMQEMVKLIYKDDDIIFVSIHSLHRIAKYKGKDGEPPRINKLGTGAWERLKERTKSKVKDIARELIKLYAMRKAEKGFSFSPDSYLQQELEASFLYEDTPDQMKATSDLKKDMESDLPMDRLVCGDVGFGKTEVAIRAAFKAVTDSKQVAVLVPTTVLALQHYNTFRERLKEFPCMVEYLSRARTSLKTKDILNDLSEGKIDIIIGTHKLVGKSVKFKDLGLLIIDEEQKFGVSIKEKLKQLKVNVDTLTLTATPIPRTLQFSLMGARDLSIINTPPPNRFPVQTEIHTVDENIIKDAIELEMSRNGQVFFVNNRIQSIYQVASMVKRVVPGARVAVGHGQMSPDVLEEIILDFINYEYDVLVATTIIESGIDIPNVNTIIINSAHRFGLSDLHQLRGRVGRSNRKAYCYLMAPELSLLTPDARRRLQAIETFSELGSGFNIAMQDLDIRGAGNMLGAEQSGFIADLGFETYQRILNEAMLELKDEEFAELFDEERVKNEASSVFVNDCQIDTDIELLFPEYYIENVSERISLYRELDGIENEEALKDFVVRLHDRFGEIPEKSISLIEVVRLRWLAIMFGVEKLVLKNERMTAFLVSNAQSVYYQSDYFGRLLRYITNNPRRCQIRENNGKRSVVISPIKTVEEAKRVFEAF